VIYPDKFTGSYGTPGNLGDVQGTGDQVYQISTSEGIAVASIQKADGTSETLTVEVYKDGTLVTQKSTVTPRGIVEIQADLKPVPTPTKVPIPVATTGTSGTSNSTVNASATN
jgi:hypothetical protein